LDAAALLVTIHRSTASRLFCVWSSSMCVSSDDDVSRGFDVVVDLPTVNTVKLPVYVEFDIPSVVSVQSTAAVVYIVHNRTDLMQDFDVVIESSDSFMFAGHRQVRVRLKF